MFTEYDLKAFNLVAVVDEETGEIYITTQSLESRLGLRKGSLLPYDHTKSMEQLSSGHNPSSPSILYALGDACDLISYLNSKGNPEAVVLMSEELFKAIRSLVLEMEALRG
jgi:hypothetical protein